MGHIDYKRSRFSKKCLSCQNCIAALYSDKDPNCHQHFREGIKALKFNQGCKHLYLCIADESSLLLPLIAEACKLLATAEFPEEDLSPSGWVLLFVGLAIASRSLPVIMENLQAICKVTTPPWTISQMQNLSGNFTSTIGSRAAESLLTDRDFCMASVRSTSRSEKGTSMVPSGSLAMMRRSPWPNPTKLLPDLLGLASGCRPRASCACTAVDVYASFSCFKSVYSASKRKSLLWT